MKLSRLVKEDIRRIGELAHLELTEKELEVFSSQLSEIINYMSDLRGVDVAGMPLMPRTKRSSCPLRDDIPGPSFRVDEMFFDRPTDDEGCLVVPSVVAAK